MRVLHDHYTRKWPRARSPPHSEGTSPLCSCCNTNKPTLTPEAAALLHSFWLSGPCAREYRYQNRLYSKELLSQASGIKLHLGVCCRHVFTKHTTTQIFQRAVDIQDNSSSSNLNSHVIQAKEGPIIHFSSNLIRSKALSLANQCQSPSYVKTKKQTKPKQNPNKPE